MGGSLMPATPRKKSKQVWVYHASRLTGTPAISAAHATIGRHTLYQEVMSFDNRMK
jgi:hypothetical protein